MDKSIHSPSPEDGKILRAAGTMAGLTVVSRILGLVRDMAIAYVFGTGPAADAFFVAFRIPNVLRRLFAEGALTISFVPVFTDRLHKDGRAEARKIFSITFTLLAVTLFAVSVIGSSFSPLMIRAVAPGFSSDPARFDLAVLLNRVMFPFILLVCLAALSNGALNSFGYFFPTGAAPVLLNLCMILSALYLSPVFSPGVLGLALGVMLGGLAQLIIQFPFLGKEKFFPSVETNFSHPAVRQVLGLMVPAAIGASVYQIDVFITLILSSYLPRGSVSYLWYADRFFEFPLGLFAVSVATAVLPSLSKKAAAGDTEGFLHALSYSLRVTFFICIPAMIGLILLREPLVRIVFERGTFTRESSVLTAQALFCYALGLPVVAGARVFVQAYYAMKDTRSPVGFAVISFLVDILFAVWLMGPLKHAGLALATSISTAVNFLLLALYFPRKVRGFPVTGLVLSLMKTSAAAAVMGLIVFLIFRGGPGGYMARLFLSLMGGVTAFFAASFFLRSDELMTIWNTVLSKPT